MTLFSDSETLGTSIRLSSIDKDPNTSLIGPDNTSDHGGKKVVGSVFVTSYQWGKDGTGITICAYYAVHYAYSTEPGDKRMRLFPA